METEKRGETRQGRGDCGIYLKLEEDREEVSSLQLLSVWLPAVWCWGHTEILTNGLRSTDNLILWHIINYDSLSIIITTSQKRKSGIEAMGLHKHFKCAWRRNISFKPLNVRKVEKYFCILVAMVCVCGRFRPVPEVYLLSFSTEMHHLGKGKMKNIS